jgi:putative phosphoribosyl transferase
MVETAVAIAAGGVSLSGDLVVPRGVKGVVLFAHGSGSSRLSPRNRYVAQVLQARGLATLLFDLLTEAEATVRARVFDIPLLAERLSMATDWIGKREDLGRLPMGYFGASTGAAAALVAAARKPEAVRAIVSRGGRPDLAQGALEKVTAPTLLIVGGNDAGVLDLNREAARRLRGTAKLEIIPGAGHLFEEPGALAKVAELAAAWFESHL